MIVNKYRIPVRVQSNPYRLSGVIDNVLDLGDGIKFADLYYKGTLVGVCATDVDGWVIHPYPVPKPV